jgi:hypothetical protein
MIEHVKESHTETADLEQVMKRLSPDEYGLGMKAGLKGLRWLGASHPRALMGMHVRFRKLERGARYPSKYG